MDKHYDPKSLEQEFYSFWESNNFFAPNMEHQEGQSEQNNGDDTYCIMIPPPNVTGTLHMGHAFQDTLMDTLIRYHRMQGKNTLWQPGTDHAGIATQMVVERQLGAQGVSRADLGREKFIERVWDWKKQSGSTITQQLRRMGASLDWQHERFTMDEGLSHAVQETFIQLYEENLIYRGKRLVNWDPVLHTAISDLEVISEEEDTYLWHFKYPLVDDSGTLSVATTRPETMLGDTAVAVHPDDPRFKNLVGKMIRLPICDREIPIIADEFVEMEFGSGCVKITPAHDFNDYEVGVRHQLPMINIFTADAKINDNAPAEYRGCDRYAARKMVEMEFERLGLLAKKEPYKTKIPRGDRSQTIIEPFLTDQWFVRTESLAKDAIEAVESGQIRFVPENWSKTYFEWMRNIEDWCISRQLWWGHRIPAWYDEQGNIYVGRCESEIREKYDIGASIALRQDEDVLDTWYSSALWPFSTLGWPDKTSRLKTFYPTSVLVTGFDIIFFWVARMIMMGLKFMGEVPFHEVYIHGLIRDGHGQKMSKSKGNVLDPIDLIDGIELESLLEKRTSGLMQPDRKPQIEKLTRKEFPQGIPSYGTDALRFTFCSLATQGRDVRFDLKRIEGYRNFCNKLWNASRFVLMNVGEFNCADTDVLHKSLGAADRWINARLQQTIVEVDRHFEQYRFDLASQAIYEFTWNDYCDWYLEMAKITLNDPSSSLDSLAYTRHTLITVLETLLRLAHPMIPYITESIWQQLKPVAGKPGETIMLEQYPSANTNEIEEQSIGEIEDVKNLVTAVRSLRGENRIPVSAKVIIEIKGITENTRGNLEIHDNLVKKLAKIKDIRFVNTACESLCATAVLQDAQIYMMLDGMIDIAAETARLNKEIEKITKAHQRSQQKLGNKNFLSKAPAELVEQERERFNQSQAALDKLKIQLEHLIDRSCQS